MLPPRPTMRPMRIALIAEDYYPQRGGVPEHVHHLAGELNRRGHSATIVTSHMRNAGPDPAYVRRVGTSLVIYDDSLGLYAARAWWSLRAYGFESARILDGGLPAWVAEGRPLSNASYPAAASVFTPRANPRLRLTTADVRALLGSPDVLLIDARAAAEYRGLEGNARRLGHIAGAINVAVGAMNMPGTPQLRGAGEVRDPLTGATLDRAMCVVFPGPRSLTG